MAVQISILIANAASLVALGHTRIEIWRSTDDGNSYEEVTASVAKAAELRSTAASTLFRMGGKTLKLKVNGGSEVSVSFSSVLPYWTPTQVANRINEVVPGLASVVGSSVLLTSPTTGRSSVLEVTYCDASDLGWSSGDVARGLDARLVLASGTTSYQYSDVAGATSDRYKWRFSADGSEPTSEFSSYVPGATPPVAGSLSVCSATFLGADGRPVRRKVIVGTLDTPQSIGGYLIGNDQPLVFEADANGFVQFTLVQGAKVRIAIEGTSFVRELTVPAASSFDLLTEMAAAADPYTVQSAPESMIRRSF